MTTHLAAVMAAKGQPFTVQSRPTPKPGPNELLIAVKAVALNPADGIMRDTGLFIPTYPTVIGFDMAGLVLEVGDSVPTTPARDGAGPFFQPNVTRIAAYAASCWRACDPDYGPFQERCLVPWQHAVPIPDPHMSWAEAATLPVSLEVPLNAWHLMGFPRLGNVVASTASTATNIHYAGEGVKADTAKKEALLVWGASSSVGSMGVQTARLLREDSTSSFAAVYATAGSVNLDYVTSLGADRVFDYKDTHVVEAIIAAAKADGLAIRHCFLAMGELKQCQAVLKTFVDERRDEVTAKIASAPPVAPDAEVMTGIETIFLQPSAVEEERLEQFRYRFGTWLRENLAKKTVRPSPELTVAGRGVEAINAGVDRLLRGVSCTKLVIELAD